MNKLKLITTLILFCFISTTDLIGQTIKPFSIRAGYSATFVRIEGAVQPSERLYEHVNNTKVFWGDGIEIGLSKPIFRNMVLDAGYASITGQGTKAKTWTTYYNAEHFYALNGFQLPITLNYLLTAPERKVHLYFGAGIQYLHIVLKQYEVYWDDVGGAEKVQKLAFNDLQLAGKASVQFGLNDRLGIITHYKASVSHKGRFTHNAFAGLAYCIK